MTFPKIKELVKQLKLKPHWSGDYLVEFYRSELMLPQKLVGDQFDGDRPAFNWAYYLLPEGVICPFHLHLADESWQYCLGGPLELYEIYSNGQLEKTIIGADIHKDHQFIHIVPKDVWMAAKTTSGAGYTLITHLVSPAFFPQDNTKGYYELLIRKFPQHKDLLQEFAWPRND